MQKLKGLGYGIYGKLFGKKKWISEMLPGVLIISLKRFMGVLDHIVSPFF